MSNEQLFNERMVLVASKAALFVSFAGGCRVAQDVAAIHARYELKTGGSAANAISVGYRYGASLMRKFLITDSGK